MPCCFPERIPCATFLQYILYQNIILLHYSGLHNAKISHFHEHVPFFSVSASLIGWFNGSWPFSASLPGARFFFKHIFSLSFLLNFLLASHGSISFSLSVFFSSLYPFILVSYHYVFFKILIFRIFVLF